MIKTLDSDLIPYYLNWIPWFYHFRMLKRAEIEFYVSLFSTRFTLPNNGRLRDSRKTC